LTASTSVCSAFFFSMIRPPPSSTLFPYTTLFRSVKDVIAYLKLATNPNDSIALTRVINTPPRGVGKTTLDDIERRARDFGVSIRSEEHTSELQSLTNLVCRLLLEKKKTTDQHSALAPPAVSLPKGGGAIRGMGEKFAANPVTCSGSMTVPSATSAGRSVFSPQLCL